MLGRQEGRVETARTFVSTGPSFSSLLPLPLLGDLGRALHGPGWGTSGVSYVGGPVSHIVLRTSVCGIEQVSVCVCRGVSTGVGPCGWVFQRCREGRTVLWDSEVCWSGGAISYIVLEPGPSEPSANAGAHPPLPLSAPQMGIVWIERNRNIRERNQPIKI